MVDYKSGEEYAIDHELRCIELRLRQVEGYLEKIELMCRGLKYDEASKRIKGIRVDFKFDLEKYKSIKKRFGSPKKVVRN